MQGQFDLPPISQLKELSVGDLAFFGAPQLDSVRQAHGMALAIQLEGLTSPTEGIRLDTKFLIKLHAAGAQARLNGGVTDAGEAKSLKEYTQRANDALDIFDTTGPGSYFADRALWSGKTLKAYRFLVGTLGACLDPSLFDGIQREHQLNISLAKIFTPQTGQAAPIV